MVNLKRYIAIFLFICLAAGIPARPVFAQKTIQVLTTTPDLKSIVQLIGKDKVEAASIAAGTENPHFITPKPSFVIKARKADLFIRSGLALEASWESLVIEGARNPKIQVGNIGHLDASEGILALEIPAQTIDRSMGDVHAFGNPHYWLDPQNAKIIASAITRRLSELSSEDASYFQDNLSGFHRKIDEKMKEWSGVLAPYRQEKIITYHKTWSYFADRFGLIVADQLEPKPGIPPSPTHLKGVVELVKRENIKVILNENIYKDNAAEYIAGKTGATVVVAPVSVGGVKEAEDYFALIDIVVQKLAKGFKQ